MKKILLSLFACLIFLFSACSPDGGQNENNSSFTVTEVGDAVADAIKGSKAVMPNTQGVTAYQMSSRVLPSDVSIDEMLLDLMKNNEFVKAYYEAFSSVEEVESISHEFDTSEYGKSYGTMTLSASGVSGVIDASNGVNIDSISVSFDDGKDVVAITEKDVSIQIGNANFASKANISMRDTRVYSGATLVSFDYSDSVDMASGNYSISVSNLVYKDQKVSDVSAVQKYVESKLSIPGGETTEPDDPNPDNPSIPGFAALVDQAAGEVFSALNSPDTLYITSVNQTLTADISLNTSDSPGTTVIRSEGPLKLYVKIVRSEISKVRYIDLTGVIELVYDGETFGTIKLDGFKFYYSGSDTEVTVESETGYKYEVSESFKNTEFDKEVPAQYTAGLSRTYIEDWMTSENGVQGLTDANVVNAFDFNIEGSFGDYDVVSINMVANYDSMTNKAEYSGVFTLEAKTNEETQPRLKAKIKVDKTSEDITYVIGELSRGSSKSDIDNLSSSTSDAIKTFVKTYGSNILDL